MDGEGSEFWVVSFGLECGMWSEELEVRSLLKALGEGSGLG